MNNETEKKKGELAIFRQEIDCVKGDLLAVISKRWRFVQQVGEYKVRKCIPPLDSKRWEHVLETRKAIGQELGISPNLIATIWNAIHAEALHCATEVALEFNENILE